jgi:drug/metabolite transporter (DMT)-like permease
MRSGPVRPGHDGLSSAADWALLVLPGLIWGASFLFIAEGLEVMAPDGVTFGRIAIGFVTLSLIPAVRAPVRRADWAGTAWLGVLWLAFPLSMFPHAEQHVSSAMTGMLNGATPLFATSVGETGEHRRRGINRGTRFVTARPRSLRARPCRLTG